MSDNIQTHKRYLIGIISDTHGRLPLAVAKVFQKVDLIIHAGDIGDPEIIAALKKIAPIAAVRGNMDMGAWIDRLHRTETITIADKRVHVIHECHHLDPKANDSEYHVIIYGHTHRPQMDKQQGVLYVNPGSAVQPRFGYPPSVALLEINGDTIKARLVDLNQ
jgi:putative phosphoesterase